MTKTTVETIQWHGLSGRAYTYWIYALPPIFTSVPGNYIFAKEVSPGRWRPIYIGETGDLGQRFDDHHKARCIQSNGATHIHVHKNDRGLAARMAEEADLVARWKPDCNG